MQSAAGAIAWEFRHRHRWGWSILGLYFLALAALRLFLGSGRLDYGDAEVFALAVLVPLTATFIYLLSVFTFGLAGDLAARESMYPSRMFTLPVSTAALVGWPMLYGTIAMIVLWSATRAFALWPAGTNVPVIWPALLAASLLTWTQTLTWMPYPLRGLRVAVTIFWLISIDAIVLVAFEFRAPEPFMLAILAPHVPLAYAAARYAVSRARRGDVPEWGRVWSSSAGANARRRGRDFRSPGRAQAWFEWKLHGRSLPWLVAILLPFELMLLFIFSTTPSIVMTTVAGVLLTPSFMAAFVAATVARANPGSDSQGLSPFLGTRPMSNAALIAAKLKTTLRSAALAWLLVLTGIATALRLSGASAVFIGEGQRLVEILGMPRAVALVVLTLVALIASTWKQLVQSLFIGLSGREWLIKGTVFFALCVLAGAVPLARWALTQHRVMAMVWSNFTTVLAGVAGLKLAAAGWVAIRLHDQRVCSGRTLVLAAAAWDFVVFSLYGLLVWILPEILFRRSLLAIVAILAVPLVRIAASPLALQWNRHR